MYYTGIGSRESPSDVLLVMERVAFILASKGLTLRSGHARGSDKAFECGCDRANGEKEIYLPWGGFEGSTSNLVVQDVKAYSIAERYHPYWKFLSDGAKKLQARNSHQVLGQNLDCPSSFLVCWTKDGKGGGGTGQAIRIARDLEISIFDFGMYSDLNLSITKFKEFLKIIK